MKASVPRAYAQGQLDYLCGIYAICNGLRQALGHDRSLERQDYRWLFAELLDQLAQRKDFRAGLSAGLGQRHVSFLLRASQSLLKRRQINLTYEKPFHGRAKIRRGQLVAAVRTQFRQPSSAVIIGFGGHWSVIRGVTRSSFRLFDSAWFSRVTFNQLTIGSAARPSRNKHRMLPCWLYVVRAASDDNNISE